MLELRSQFLFELNAELREPWNVGQGPLGTRKIYDVTGGSVYGPQLKGRLLPSGGDWLLIGSDGVCRLDIRAAFELDDRAVVYSSYLGRLIIPLEIWPKVQDPKTVEDVDPSSYYFRTAPTFETSSVKYNWLNRIQAIGVGRITKLGVAYKVYEIL